MTFTPTIAIVGGGPAGLTLARLLQLQGIKTTVFEAEISRDCRTQGGTLDLHGESGLQAVREAGLWDEFVKHARPEGEDMVIADKTGKRWLDDGGHVRGSDEDIGKGHSRPEIDREDLRKILLSSVEPSNIRWNSKLLNIGEDGILHFEHGQEGPFDLVVGADGSRSKVRPRVSSAEPFYSGISGLEFRYPDVDQKYPELSKMVGEGSFFAFSDGKSIMAQRLGDRSIRATAWLKKPEHDAAIPEEREVYLKQFDDWVPELRACIELEKQPARSWRLYMLPVDHKWTSKPGFTLIGDAAHLITPFAGEGVNMAMLDSLELAHAITKTVKEGSDASALAAAIKSYEEGMFPRVEVEARDTEDNMNLMFMQDAPAMFMEKMARVMGGGPPQ